jgi:hypothetical protein
MDWKFEGFEDGAEPTPAATGERDLVPEGSHALEIVRASEEGADLKLALAHADKRFGWVWANCPRDKDWGARIVSSLARALGMSPADWNETAPDQLVGRTVAAEIYHKAGNSGRVFVNVRKFTAAEAPPKAATRSRSAKPAAVAPDDIPF